MDNKRLKKYFEQLQNDDKMIQDHLNRIVTTFSQNLQNIFNTQHQMVLTLDTLNNLLKSKNIYTEEEYKTEINKVSEDLKQKAIEMRKMIEAKKNAPVEAELAELAEDLNNSTLEEDENIPENPDEVEDQKV